MADELERKDSFGDLTARLNAQGDALADPNFDPEKLVGDVRDKVDGINAMLAAFETWEAHFRKLSKPYASKATTLKKNYDRLWDYTAHCLRTNNLEKVPGNTHRVELRKASAPKLPFSRQPDVRDFLKFPDYVKQVTLYAWDAEKVEADALAGKLLLPDNSRCDHRDNFERPVDQKLYDELGGRCLDCNRIVKPSEMGGPPYSEIPARLEWSWWPEFKVNVPESLEPKKKKSKKNKEIDV